MSPFTAINFFKIPLMFLSLIWMHASFASIENNKTIYDSSINWNDEINKRELLKTIPQWNNDVIESLFNTYKNPEDYLLPRLSNAHKYNIQFINAFWGPLDNPFNQYPRPAKAFVFFNHQHSGTHGTDSTPKIFYMAPVIKNLNDGNYYIFNNLQSKPVLLNDWITSLLQFHQPHHTVLFNICNGYGNFPNDSCLKKSYQDEANDISDNYARQHSSLIFPRAHREIKENWTQKINFKQLNLNRTDTIYDTSITWSDVTARNELLETVVTWPNYQIIKESFEKLRDIRYFDDKDYPGFSRRISWLFPDDGCWTRASAVIRDLFGPLNFSNSKTKQLSRPSKVFAFGNLCAVTPNSPDQYVAWWYHTAPIIRDAETNVTYVLDPSINPYHPITLQQWVSDISSTSFACSNSSSMVDIFNICNGYGSSPYDNCNSRYSIETESIQSQPYFHLEERERQIELGRDANAVLGSQPPWLNK